MKKISLLTSGALVLFLFAGCFNFDVPPEEQTGSEVPVDSSSKLYETNEFSIVIPREWEIIEKPDFPAAFQDETEVVFRNNVKNDVWTATIAIVKKPIESTMNSEEFGKTVINRQNHGLTNYQELKKQNITLSMSGQNQESLLVNFEARLSASEQLVRYLQTYATKESSGYIALGSFSPQEKEDTIGKVEQALRSFTIK